jgi:hypothetical protein
LRALRQAAADDCPVAAYLNVGDTRTLAQLLERAGLPTCAQVRIVPISQFLRVQKLVGHRNEALNILSRRLQSLEISETRKSGRSKKLGSNALNGVSS